MDAEQLAFENKQIKGLVRMALDELGVPNKDYPSPVANAVGFLKEALKEAKPILADSTQPTDTG